MKKVLAGVLVAVVLFSLSATTVFAKSPQHVRGWRGGAGSSTATQACPYGEDCPYDGDCPYDCPNGGIPPRDGTGAQGGQHAARGAQSAVGCPYGGDCPYDGDCPYGCPGGGTGTGGGQGRHGGQGGHGGRCR